MRAMKKTMKGEGMHCGGCSGRLKRTLEALPEVESAEASHETGIVVVTLKAELSDDALRNAVEGAKFTVLSMNGSY